MENEFKIDEKDRKILFELQKDSRASFSRIGKAVGLPKTVVAYRIKRLIDSGFLTLFCSIISKSRLGYIYSRLFIKFHNFDEAIEKKLIAFLEKKKGMHWIASLDGRYDFCVILLTKGFDELKEIYSDVIYNFSEYILDKDLSIALDLKYQSFRYVFGDQPLDFNKTNKKPVKDIKISSLDIKIINLIKQNSRFPLLDISKKLKVSPQTVRNRISVLRELGVIGAFRIRINHKMLGFHHFHTFLNLSNIDKETEKEIVDYILSLPSTIHIIKGTGKYDLEFESLLRSHFELYDVIKQIRNKFPKNIQNVDSALIYKIHEINTVQYEA